MSGVQQVQEKLAVPDMATVRRDLDLGEAPAAATAGGDRELDSKADSLATALLDFNATDLKKQDDLKAAVEQMGYQVQRKAAEQSRILDRPLKDMSARGEEGGEVAKALIDLKMQVEELDPARADLSAGWFSRALGKLPGVGTPLKRYFSRFESAQTVINAIINSLEHGREELKRDNVTLAEDQKRMRELTQKLERAVRLGQALDAKIAYRLERDIAADDPRRKFIEEEILFALRQRIMDLQQQLAVNQQGVLAAEIVIRNNKELMRGVNRALNVTVNALQVAVTVAMALENQRIVLDKVNALSKTTDALIANTAARLRTQGAEIHKQASTTQLDMETLKQAFADINAAMADIADFRRNALPQMAGSIIEMERLTGEAERSIRKMEDAKRAEPTIQIEA